MNRASAPDVLYCTECESFVTFAAALSGTVHVLVCDCGTKFDANRLNEPPHTDEFAEQAREKTPPKWRVR